MQEEKEIRILLVGSNLGDSLGEDLMGSLVVGTRKLVSDIKQGYLSRGEITSRIRTKSINNYGRAYLTVKGPRSSGTCFEAETEIDYTWAENLFNARIPGEVLSGVIEKKRINLYLDGRTFEVDVFGGNLKGLVIAEIEYTNVDPIDAGVAADMLRKAILKDFLAFDATNYHELSNSKLTGTLLRHTADLTIKSGLCYLGSDMAPVDVANQIQYDIKDAEVIFDSLSGHGYVAGHRFQLKEV